MNSPRSLASRHGSPGIAIRLVMSLWPLSFTGFPGQ